MTSGEDIPEAMLNNTPFLLFTSKETLQLLWAEDGPSKYVPQEVPSTKIN